MTSGAADQVWNDVLLAVRQRVTGQAFETWFRPISFEGCDEREHVLRLCAPNQVVRDWVTQNFSDALYASLKDSNLPDYHVRWSINEKGKDVHLEPETETTEPVSVVKSAPEARRKSKASPTQERRLLTMMEGGTPATELECVRALEVDLDDSALNQKCKFQTFVVGSCNRFAHAAALGVAAAPGKTYNPLYVYGGVGLGKTHLMHAIGHAIKERNRRLRLSYLSTETFMNELINSIRYQRAQKFREKYRSIDVLLMDDIQFMARKEATQEEFFHTFNALYDAQKQIVITSDCPPKEIPTLEERLRSRFEWGLIADIEPPDLETKLAILKRKADADNVRLPDDVALFIASKIKSSIRELEGSLVRLVAFSSLKAVPITKALAEEALRNIADESHTPGLTIQQIQRSVATHYRLRLDDLRSKNNSRHIAVPRQIAMYLCKRYTKHSYPEIGREFGGKHHTTVIHSVEKITSLLSSDSDLQTTISRLVDNLEK